MPGIKRPQPAIAAAAMSVLMSVSLVVVSKLYRPEGGCKLA
jgi:hypothetical protein